jgi:hypothetical protein
VNVSVPNLPEDADPKATRRVRVVLPPKGVVTIHRSADAMGKKFGPAYRRDGECQSDEVPAPLPAGRYQLLVRVLLEGGSPRAKRVAMTVRK